MTLADRAHIVPSAGAVLGIDVGCSAVRRSSAICRIAWSAHEVTWDVARFRAIEPERTETIIAVAGGLLIACAAFDGPLRRGLDGIGRYRTAERMLTRRLARKIGKPGASSAPVGQVLNAHANACARTVLQHCDVALATHATRIDDRAVVEAFPSAFLGVMIDEPSALAARRHNRSDVFFVRGCERQGFDLLIDHLLPGRQMAHIPDTLTDHDERAAFVCALTALCVARGDYTAVGDQDGWVILPPYALLQPWAREDLEANADEEAMRASPAAATFFAERRGKDSYDVL